jgi:hypothetical protein
VVVGEHFGHAGLHFSGLPGPGRVENGAMEAPTVSSQVMMRHRDGRPGLVRTLVSLVGLLAVLLVSWALVIGLTIVVLRLVS